jgi:hypothetical protein
MPGDETHGYDLVIEFAEQAYQELLTAIFDSADFLTNALLDPLHIDDTDGFRVSMLFDRPGDVDPSAVDPVDLRVEVGDVSDPIADLRMVVGVDVDRTGASDDLGRGQSTFMVEMSETANILNNATARSLVVLDEIGRGTSTFDGLSLAWACASHIANSLRAFTLFATHYFELTELAEKVNSSSCSIDKEDKNKIC